MDANQKQNVISDYAVKLISRKARQLVGTAGFTKSDIEDLEQEMILDLLERLPKYDPDKAAQNTFVTRLVERKISKLIRDRKREIRNFCRESCSLNDLLEDPEGNTIERAYTIDQDRASIRIGRRNHTSEEEAQLRLDVSLVLSGLPDDLRPIAERLKTQTLTEAANSLGIPRTTLYGAKKRLRRIFEDAGLRHYL